MAQANESTNTVSPAEEAASISTAAIAEAEKLAGLAFTESERELMLEGVNKWLQSYEKLRGFPLENSVPPAFSFDPELPEKGAASADESRPISYSQTPGLTSPSDVEELAFAPVTQLAQLIRSKQISSLALTQMYLERLKRYGPALSCVVTVTEELALSQAERADEEIARGEYRGPLHGIPWGAKDLLATRDIPTTWGALPYQDQIIDLDATVVQRLRDAGAVLIAKLSMGALAWGDVWFGGQTKNPWNLEEGSRGSSAGSASAAAAGLVGFAIGTETHGSIIAPCHRCGLTGLRPTFGRVSRYGAMALSWSMDKIGPICRSAEDCALVFNVIHGADGHDSTAVSRPFHWDPESKPDGLRIGYLKSAFEEHSDGREHNEEALQVIASLGTEMIPIELPNYPVDAFSMILRVEAAAAFDELTRSNRDDLLVRQAKDAWPNVFRTARLVPAVEYLQANRLRTLLKQDMARLMQGIDLYITPSLDKANLLFTNLTGHPAVVVPDGFSTEGTLCSSLTLIGRLFDEARILTVAKAYQDRTGFHLRHPKEHWS
jgi:Asp-tRNA(Asn)/Glu-tRNA(Gln) amidotransferase A subunit family amidase